MSNDLVPQGYGELLADLKARVRAAQLRAHRIVNTELLALYWAIGAAILERQSAEGWGTRIIHRLAADLRTEFPEMRGFSGRNLHYMTAAVRAWPGLFSQVGAPDVTLTPIVQQLVAQLPWGHVTTLLDRLDDQDDRDWYAGAAVEHGWSRAVLLNQIKNRLRSRAGAAPSSFAARLTPDDSELAQQLTRDPYVFDFLDLSASSSERELEQGLIDRLQHTLSEFGRGFSFVGRQVHFDVEGHDFFIDLLFFHVEQMRYVVVELNLDPPMWWCVS
ncbi:MAG: PDDEXK nuclease domain-containing protein [Micrococcales bacterium]|nr:PDDEXK nuclease domain-containing protein [Micrococcales bacterium]